MQRCWWGWECEKRCSSTSWRIYSLLQPLITPAQRGWRQHGQTTAPGKAGGPCVRRCRVSGLTRDTAHLPHERKCNAVHSAPWNFASGTAAGRSSTDLSKRSFTLAYKTPCDFEVTAVITEQAQKSSNFPGPQELLPASCPQAFPAPEASFLSDTHQLQKELLHSNYFT